MNYLSEIMFENDELNKVDWVDIFSKVYRNAKKLGNTQKDKKGIFGWMDEWYTTKFRYDDLEIVIREWCHGMSMDNWLDSMTICYNGRKVYHADVHRNSASRQRVDVFSKNIEWLEQIGKFFIEYS